MKADQPNLLMDALFIAQGLVHAMMKDEPAASATDRNLHPHSIKHRPFQPLHLFT